MATDGVCATKECGAKAGMSLVLMTTRDTFSVSCFHSKRVLELLLLGFDYSLACAVWTLCKRLLKFKELTWVMCTHTFL